MKGQYRLAEEDLLSFSFGRGTGWSLTQTKQQQKTSTGTVFLLFNVFTRVLVLFFRQLYMYSDNKTSPGRTAQSQPASQPPLCRHPSLVGRGLAVHFALFAAAARRGRGPIIRGLGLP